MASNLLSRVGMSLNTFIVILGWVAFSLGVILRNTDPVWSIVFMAAARALP